MTTNPDIVWEDYYLALYKDGTIYINDGVGYAGELNKEETRELYEALKAFMVMIAYNEMVDKRERS